MSAAFGAVFALVLLLSLGAGLLLYWLVRSERSNREVMARDEAERAARRDVSDGEE